LRKSTAPAGRAGSGDRDTFAVTFGLREPFLRERLGVSS
jgi:hypothetical protein